MLMRHTHITNRIVYISHIDHKNNTTVTRRDYKDDIQFYYTKVPLYVPLLVVLYISWYEILSETFFNHFYTEFNFFRMYISNFPRYSRVNC